MSAAAVSRSSRTFCGALKQAPQSVESSFRCTSSGPAVTGWSSCGIVGSDFVRTKRSFERVVPLTSNGSWTAHCWWTHGTTSCSQSHFELLGNQ